jgi:AraC-like DNA-binding protein
MTSILKIEDVRASVRIANHHPVAANTLWERSLPDLQFVCILAGRFDYQEADQPALHLDAGDILFIEPNIRHRFWLSTSCAAGEIAGMHLELLPGARWAAGEYRLARNPSRVTHLHADGYVPERFKHLADVYESYQPYRAALVNALATEIVLILAAYWEDESERAARPSPRMETILAYIREHLASPLTRQSLAETFNLSAGYINQLFKLELGMSPSAVINRERAARAYELIDREGLPVAEAAQAVGFEDPFYFSRVFKQIYTIPPSQVRGDASGRLGKSHRPEAGL